MKKSVHYIGVNLDGQLIRFAKEFDDDEFETFLKEIGGQLPKGFFAWHLVQGENMYDSRKVAAMAKFPVARTLFGTFVDPVEEIKNILKIEK